MTASELITNSLRDPVVEGMAVAAYLTAGFPDQQRFEQCARALAREVDLLEIGVPFSDPMADGPTIQRTSAAALRSGVTIESLLDSVGRLGLPVPVVLMSYLNPLARRGLNRVLEKSAAAGVSGFIVPDLPLEASRPLSRQCDDLGMALVQLVTPVSSDNRVREICRASAGFVYAVATTGTTGGQSDIDDGLGSYLESVSAHAALPVLAGFGIRGPAQVTAIQGKVDGIVVGSALLEAIERNDDPVAFIRHLVTRPTTGKAAS